MLRLCVHHASYKHNLCEGVWFDSKWSTLVYSTFVIDPFELVKLILDGSRKHPLFQLAQVGSRVDVIPQRITWFRRYLALSLSSSATLPNINVEGVANCASIV